MFTLFFKNKRISPLPWNQQLFYVFSPNNTCNILSQDQGFTIATLIPTKNQNREPKAHNFERNSLSNENLFEYSQAPSKKPPKDNLTTKFNPSRYRIITTQRSKTRIQKLKKQSHHSWNPPRDKETKKSSQRDSVLFNT